MDRYTIALGIAGVILCCLLVIGACALGYVAGLAVGRRERVESGDPDNLPSEILDLRNKEQTIGENVARAIRNAFPSPQAHWVQSHFSSDPTHGYVVSCGSGDNPSLGVVIIINLTLPKERQILFNRADAGIWQVENFPATEETIQLVSSMAHMYLGNLKVH